MCWGTSWACFHWPLSTYFPVGQHGLLTSHLSSHYFETFACRPWITAGESGKHISSWAAAQVGDTCETLVVCCRSDSYLRHHFLLTSLRNPPSAAPAGEYSMLLWRGCWEHNIFRCQFGVGRYAESKEHSVNIWHSWTFGLFNWGCGGDIAVCALTWTYSTYL